MDNKIVSFRDVVKQQLADEIQDSVGETVKKEVESHMSEEFSDVRRTIEESTQRVADIRISVFIPVLPFPRLPEFLAFLIPRFLGIKMPSFPEKSRNELKTIFR